ncbi:MAG: OsmC family protein [Acidimicrobiales bacterium]
MTSATTDTGAPTADNGVNVAHLLGARQALTDAPAAAKFRWQARCDWVRGTHSRTTMLSFFGLGEDQQHRQSFALDADHPEIFASEDNGPTPPEIVLAALASCLTAGVATVATNRGVQLRSVTATVQGDMDLAGILGIDGDVRNGFDEIRVAFAIDADATPAEVEAIVAQSQKRSAVFDIIANPTTVTVTVA